MLFWFTAASTELRATALSDVAAAVQAGQWAELVTTGFDSATLDDGGAYAVFWYAEDIAWDAARQQLLFVGGGHGSDPEFLTYSEATNAWTRRKPGGGIPWDTYFSETYDHLALIPSLGRLYFRQPAFTPSDRIEIYDIVAGTWTRSPLMPNRPACCGALEYFPELGGLVNVAGPGPVYFYDPAANAWSTLAASVSIGEYHNFAQYSPVHRVMIFGGGEGPNGTALYRMDANRQITRLNNAPQRMGTTYSIVTTDPVSGNFLVFFDNASYQFNPMTQVWTLLPGVPPWRPIGYAGVFAAVATSLPEYGVVLVAKYAGDNSRVYLYRHTASSGPPPTITFSAEPGTVASGGSSVLSWTTTGASNCTGAGGTGAWPGAKSVPNGSETVGPIATTTTFSLSCAGPGGTAQSSVVVSVYPLPAVTLTADPASVIVGETTQLTWSTQNANSCVASGAWAGPRALAGSETSQPLSVNSTFTLECSGVGGSASRSVTVNAVNPPPPTINGMNPESVVVGGPGFTLTVDGSNFVAGSVVRWNGVNRATTLISASQLTATIPAEDIAATGTAQVTVFNPPPGGGLSNARTFTIADAPFPVPVTSGVSPTSAVAGSVAFTLTVNGSNFVASSVVRWNGANRTTTFVSATQLMAAIPATDVAVSGNALVTVFTPVPGGGTSNSQTFAIEGPPPATGGLVAAYSFNAGAGTIAADVSGAGNTGTLNGATWTASGRYGSALTFNGTNNQVTVNDANSLDVTTGMTMEAWVYPTVAPSGWRGIVIKEGPSTALYHLHASSSRSNRPATGVFVAGKDRNLFGSTRLTANTWVHLAATYDGTTQRLYVNGAEVASRAQSGAIQTSANPLRIGGSTFGEYFQGRIDEVRIYNRALSVVEIQNDMNTPLGP
jgi:hypothetical protein